MTSLASTNSQSKMAATLRAEAMAATIAERKKKNLEFLESEVARRNGGRFALNSRRKSEQIHRNKVRFAEANGEWIDIDGTGKKHRQPRGAPRNSRHFVTEQPSKSSSKRAASEVTFFRDGNGGFACLVDDDSSDSEDENENETHAITIPASKTIPTDGRGPFNSPLPSPAGSWAAIASVGDAMAGKVVQFAPKPKPGLRTPANSPIVLDLSAAIEGALGDSKPLPMMKIKNNCWADEMDSDSDEE